MKKVKVFNPFKVDLPVKSTPFSAAMDIRANVSQINPKFIFDGYIDRTGSYGETGTVNSAIVGTVKEGAPEALVLFPNGRALIPSGLKMQLPKSHSMDVRPRSGLALKYGIEIVNSPGLIDEDYRGDVGIIIKNGSSEKVAIVDGERIAQIKINADIPFEWEEVENESDLSVTERGEGGFNSTGTK